MEIKIVEHEKTKETFEMSYKTHIFEGENIRHEHIYFKDQEDFAKKHKERTDFLSGNMIGIEDDLCNTEKEKMCGQFILIYYDKNNERKYIIIRNSKIFITNKGQTIDTIII